MLSLPISVVTVWLFINVIKVFDIIYVMTAGGPGDVEPGDRVHDVRRDLPERARPATARRSRS